MLALSKNATRPFAVSLSLRLSAATMARKRSRSRGSIASSLSRISMAARTEVTLVRMLWMLSPTKGSRLRRSASAITACVWS